MRTPLEKEIEFLKIEISTRNDITNIFVNIVTRHAIYKFCWSWNKFIESSLNEAGGLRKHSKYSPATFGMNPEKFEELFESTMIR